MSSAHPLHDQLGEPPSGELDGYGAISALAVVSLLVGVGSVAALMAVPLWLLPVVGILISCLALFRITRSAGALIGRPVALAGLALSVFFGTAAVADYLQSQRLIERDAEQVAKQWFLALAQNDPELAHQWTRNLGARAGIDDPLLLKGYYENDKKMQDALTEFVETKPVGALLRLGKQAHVQLESSPMIDFAAGYVAQVYRVTGNEAGEPVAFSIELLLETKAAPGQKRPRWRVRRWALAGSEPELSVD